MNERRYELDWLRVIAFAILIYFHAAIAFIPGGLPMIQNNETHPVFVVGVNFFHQFRLSLLFFISGAGMAFSRRKLENRQFLKQRTSRLLIPFLFGILTVVPLAVYFEKRFIGAFDGTFVAFYPRFFTEGVYPAGNLSWHHFWFIAYLYIYCLLGLWLFGWLDTAKRAKSLLNWLINHQRAAILLPLLPLVIAEILLRAVFPGFRDLIHDWASFTHWFLFFVAGYILARHLFLLDQVIYFRQHCLVFGLIAFTLLFYLFHQPTGGLTPVKDGTATVVDYIAFTTLRATNAWLWVLTCLGYAGRYLRFTHPVLSYLNRAVYPFFVLHLTVIAILSYWIVRLDMGVWYKYGLVCLLTSLILLACYQLLIRPIRFLRLLTGAGLH